MRIPPIAMSRVGFPKRIELAVFNYSGTFFDCGASQTAGVIQRVFSEKGLPITKREARGPLGFSMKDHIREILKTTRVSEFFQLSKRRRWEERDVVQLYHDFNDVFHRTLALHPIPGAKETLGFIQGELEIKVAIITPFNREITNSIFKQARHFGFQVDAWISIFDVSTRHPCQQLIRHAMSKTRVHDPEKILRVGITPLDMGVKMIGAKSIWTLGLTSTSSLIGYNWTEIQDASSINLLERVDQVAYCLERSGADFVRNRITALPEVIELINTLSSKT